ncbi:MAG: dGTPase [Sulfuricurvum sp.]|nr:dGTPase [Sulfuricurvum sp.]MDD5387511.1 dGTPase [Sulfuricurvum sp.]
MIDYHKKLTIHRAMNEIQNIDGSVESDRGRIISAPALRRLQKRTQVFALELNAAVRSRLTHSLEVQQTSRYIARSILAAIKKEDSLQKYGLEDLDNAFVSTAEMASLLHDIGNPPFGHSAEESINAWMAKEAPLILKALYPDMSEAVHSFRDMLLNDLSSFDGNAQAIRIVHKLQRLNLSYTQTAAILKYTRGAFEPKPDKSAPLSYLQKKPGYYYSEKEFVETVCETLEMAKGSRFPITYIMEAADDISYLTADLEDAVDKKILTLDKIYELIMAESPKVNAKYGTEENYLADLVQTAYDKAQKNEAQPYRFNMFLVSIRAALIGKLVAHVTKIYMENHEAVFNGTFNHPLLEFDQKSPYFIALKILQNISIKHIYHNREVETLEIKGDAILTGLLNLYKPILSVSSEDMAKLLKDERIDNTIASKFFRRLSQKHIVAYSVSVDGIEEENSEEERRLREWYYRARLLLDYISGMTDDYALQEYQTLMAL